MSEIYSPVIDQFRQFCDTLKIYLKFIMQQLINSEFCDTLKINNTAIDQFRQFCDTLKICLKFIMQQFRQFCDTLKIHLKACLKISNVSEECWNSS